MEQEGENYSERSEEHLERKQIALQMDGWKTITKTEEVIIIPYKSVICHIVLQEIPQQENGSDCGMFLLK